MVICADCGSECFACYKCDVANKENEDLAKIKEDKENALLEWERSYHYAKGLIAGELKGLNLLHEYIHADANKKLEMGMRLFSESLN